VLALAAANTVGLLLFVTLYIVAGLRYLPQPAFLACLAILFVMVTALWLRVEARHRTLDALRRLGRVTGGLLIVLIAAPALLLMPVFWLESALPEEAGMRPVLAPLMSVMLISLALITGVNVVGALAAVAHAVVRRMR
jgi:Flp pilus assembly protein TadB